FSGARYPSGKGEVCKTFMRRFDSDPRLHSFNPTVSKTPPKRATNRLLFVSAFAIMQPGGCIMTDCIEKRIELKAPISRVWRALTDYREFGEWFRVKLDGPFVPGQVSHGQMTYPGYEHVRWEAVVQKMEPERLFSFTWPHPKSLEKAHYSPDTS